MSTQYSYNLIGTERKALVQMISKILDKPSVYQKAPTFAYTIGAYNVDKNGTLFCSDDADPKETEQLIFQLKEHDYISEDAGEIALGKEEVKSGRTALVTEDNEVEGVAADINSFVVEVSIAGFSEDALKNLRKIIDSKAPLFKKAIGTDNLEVIANEEILQFPWFTLHGLDDEADAYSRLIWALCEMTKRQKRVTIKECSMENEKFTMRLFLVRLGFIGNEYKSMRKILLRNLSGNSSWKLGHRPKQAPLEEKQKEGDTHYEK